MSSESSPVTATYALALVMPVMRVGDWVKTAILKGDATITLRSPDNGEVLGELLVFAAVGLLSFPFGFSEMLARHMPKAMRSPSPPPAIIAKKISFFIRISLLY